MGSTLKIQTLDEILADMGEPVSADFCDRTPSKSVKTNKSTSSSPSHNTSLARKINPSDKPLQSLKPLKPSTPSAVSLLLNDVNQTVLDDQSLKLLSQVEIEKLQVPDKETRYLRWLAFYYLSKRELSQHELKSKLIAKNCDPIAVDELLHEFAEKNYQSDERCATMIVREAIRKGRGVRYISEQLKKSGLNAKDFGGIDELITLADIASVSDGTILEGHDNTDEIDWLRLAVEARSKKYGDNLPTTPKEKSRQWRFLQYRGFDTQICFKALTMTLADFD